MKALAWCLVVAALLLPLGGCIVAVGSTTGSGEARMKRLEERLSAAEKKLGIPTEVQR